MKFFRRFDGNDLHYYLGLLLLGAGLGLAVSWPVAISVVGAVLVAVSVWSSYQAERNGG